MSCFWYNCLRAPRTGKEEALGPILYFTPFFLYSHERLVHSRPSGNVGCLVDLELANI